MCRKLYGGEIDDDEIAYTIKFNINLTNQIILYEFYILKKWLKTHITNKWAITLDENDIYVYLTNKKSLALLKINKISSRYHMEIL